MFEHALAYFWVTLKFNAIFSNLSVFNESNKILFNFKHYDAQKLIGHKSFPHRGF